VIVLDTHVLVWWVSGAGRLSARARRAIEQSLSSGGVAVAAISIFEIATAVRRGRLEIEVTLDRWLGDLRLLPEVRLEPMTDRIAALAGSFDDAVPGDPADRIIMATAAALGTSLVSADERLRRSPPVPVIW
jgi:PIN domain nuclease of toxin-antitoxin system